MRRKIKAQRIPADGDAADFEPRTLAKTIGRSPALSMVKPDGSEMDGVATRKVAILASDGVDGKGADDPALITRARASGEDVAPAFIEALSRHRNWARAGRSKRVSSADETREKKGSTKSSPGTNR
ncbi:MAG: hypothetical protein ABIT01_10635 [Thermoanaerobaculia bacterium]